MGDYCIIDRDDFPSIINGLCEDGFAVVGPTLRDAAIVYDRIHSDTDLPIGWTDEQDGGTYRIKKRDDKALFGYVVGPHAWKKFLFPPAERLWRADRQKQDFHITEENPQAVKYAFLGVRSCELHAIAIQDKVFIGGEHADPAYRLRREDLFVLAVQCAQAGGTCFCVSMKTGPQAETGFDLALTEVITKDRHFFVTEVGTERGRTLLNRVPHRVACEDDVAQAKQIIENTAQQMGRTMETTDIKDLLYDSYEHPRWDDVAERCLTCANCTLVCPTCFCSTIEDVTDLTGDHTERWRKWDSCFTMDFSSIHGVGAVRASTKSRYRQWMTHKLATWFDQFGSSGCVGCGRCITWCPVGIDLTEEVAAIRKEKV